MNDIPAIGRQEAFSIAEVQELTGLPGRTVRYYISQGLIPSAHGRGPSATYDRAQVLRLMLIQQLRRDGLRLDLIKEKLTSLTNNEVVSQFGANTRPAGEAWRRIELHPDVELHVRSVSFSEQGRIDDIVDKILNAIGPALEGIKRSEDSKRS
jgi:DNA-binding transcriptional MerR regulator